MNIVIIGYGKMGREIEKIALERGHTIVKTIDIDNRSDLNSALAKQVDVAIEFTSPNSAINNIYSCFELGIPVVAGSTGWHEKLEEVTTNCLKGNHSLFYASNYSIGVNLFFALNEKFAQMMNSYPQYKVSMEEIHHTQKLDAPSGTAVSLANIIIEYLDRVSDWKLDSTSDKILPIKAIREGDVKGIHKVKYEAEEDYIELVHHAKSRKGFAMGAVFAAEYLKEKKGVFTMRDLLGI